MRKEFMKILGILASVVPTSFAISYQSSCPLDTKIEYVTYNNKTSALELSPSREEGNSDSDVVVYPAKRCRCSNRQTGISYCLATKGENICAIPLDASKYEPVCYEATTSAIFVRNVWPVVVLWFGAMAFYLISTDAGRGTLKFACSRVFRCQNLSNHRMVNEIVNREMDFHRQRQRERTRATNYALRVAEEGGSNVVTYILKTKAYKSDPKSPANTEASTPDTSLKSLESFPSSDDERSSPNDEIDGEPLSYGEAALTTPTKDAEETAVGNVQQYADDDDEVTCSICMMEIEDGDRIGALECDHKFHVDCLKEWIKRRNVCPLCQSPDIAKLKTNSRENQTEDSSTPQPQRTIRRIGLSSGERQQPNTESTRTRLFHVNSNGSPAFSRRGTETSTVRVRSLENLGNMITSTTRMNRLREQARQRSDDAMIR